MIKMVEKSIKNLAFEKVAIFTAEGTLEHTVVGTKNQVDLSSLKGKTEGKILTHNHPNGSSLSLEDIKYFLYNGLKEIRAVSSKHTFSLELKKEVKDAEVEFTKLVAKLPAIIKTLKQEIKDSIINDTELSFEDIDHEAVKRLFKGSRTYKFTQTAN